MDQGLKQIWNDLPLNQADAVDGPPEFSVAEGQMIDLSLPVLKDFHGNGL
jgi:hypothetical protein